MGNGPTKSIVVVSNQVFVGLPWKNVKPKYEKIVKNLEKKFPISFIIIGRSENQDAEDLFSLIINKLSTSSSAIFDATGGNPNVSLEFGYAEASNIPKVIYLSDHAASKNVSKDKAIISDLAGKKYNIYKNEKTLKKLLYTFSKNHNYTIRFESFLRQNFHGLQRGFKKSLRTTTLKIIRQLDNKERIRRADLIEGILAENIKYQKGYIEFLLKEMHKSHIIKVGQGKYSDISII